MIRQLIRYLTTSIPYLGLCGFLVLGITEVYGAEGFPEHRPRGSSVPGSSSAPTSSSSTSHDLTPDTTHSDGTISCESSVEDHEIDGSAVEQRSIGHTLEHIRQFLTGKEFNPKAINDFTSALEATTTVLELPMDWDLLDAVVNRLRDPQAIDSSSESFTDQDFFQETLKAFPVATEAKNFLDIFHTYEMEIDTQWQDDLRSLSSEYPHIIQPKDWPEFSEKISKAIQAFSCHILSQHNNLFSFNQCLEDFFLTLEKFYAYQQEVFYKRITGLTAIYTFGPIEIKDGNGPFSEQGYKNYKERLSTNRPPLNARELGALASIYEREQKGGAPYLSQVWVEKNPEMAFDLYKQAYEKLKADKGIRKSIACLKKLPDDAKQIINNLARLHKERGTLADFLEETKSLLGNEGFNFDPLIRYNIKAIGE